MRRDLVGPVVKEDEQKKSRIFNFPFSVLFNPVLVCSNLVAAGRIPHRTV